MNEHRNTDWFSVAALIFLGISFFTDIAAPDFFSKNIREKAKIVQSVLSRDRRVIEENKNELEKHENSEI